MNAATAQTISDLVSGCSSDADGYRRYLLRTCWRVEGDQDFLSRELPTVGDILDVGAVPPLLVALLQQSETGHITIMDPNVGHFRPFCEAHGISSIRSDLLQKDITEISQTYDLVCLCEVLEHLTGDIYRILERVGSWVRPNGYLYLTTPNLRSVTGAVSIFARGSGVPSKSLEPVTKQYVRAHGTLGYFGHVREYTPKEVTDLLAPFGLTHVASHYQVHPRAQTASARAIRFIERLVPPLRLFGKHLFKKSA